VDEHVDVAARDPELGGDVLPRALFEEAERDDGTLGAAQAFDAGAEADVVFRFGEEVFGAGLWRHRHLDEVIMRQGEVMASPAIASGILRDGRDVRKPFAGIGRRFAAMDELEARGERVLRALDGVLGAQTFAAGGGDNGASMLANKRGKCAENVHGLHLTRCRRARFLQT